VVPRLGSLTLDASDTTATIALPHLGPGVYTVNYQVASADDGHVTSGIFAFLVDPSGTQAPPITPTSSTSLSSGLDEVLARWLALAAVIVFVGTLIFWLFSARPALSLVGRSGISAPWAAIGLAGAAALLGLVAYLLLAARPLEEGHHAAGSATFPLDVAGPFGWTPFAMAMRVALLGAVCGCVLAASRWLGTAQVRRRDAARGVDDRGWLLATLGAGLLTMGGLSLAGHPAAEGGALLGLMDLAHLVAVAAWIGSLAGIILLARRERSAVGDALRRHSRLALVAAPVVVLSGLANSPLLLGDARELVASGYGNSLLAKALLFCVAAGIGAVNHFLARAGSVRRALRLIGAELAVGALAILAAANLVTGLPSADRQPELALPALTTAHLYGQGPASSVHVSVDLPAPGTQRYQVGVAKVKDSQPRTDVQRVVLEFTPPAGSDLAARRVQLNPSPDPSFFGVTGAYTPVVGEWGLDVVVRRKGVGIGDETIHFSVPVREPRPAERVPPADTGIGVPGPLALTWQWLPHGPAGWLLVAVLLAGCIALGLLARRRPGPGLATARAGLVVITVVIGLSIGSRAVVNAANQVPAAAQAKRNPVDVSEASVEDGLNLYRANCQACHGPDGDGEGPTALQEGLVLEPLTKVLPGVTDGEIFYRIKVGTVGSGMPGFASTLSDSDRWDIVNYLRHATP
jgi:putative copper export protein/mono/diheme cytochrome c family protein